MTAPLSEMHADHGDARDLRPRQRVESLLARDDWFAVDGGWLVADTLRRDRWRFWRKQADGWARGDVQTFATAAEAKRHD